MTGAGLGVCKGAVVFVGMGVFSTDGIVLVAKGVSGAILFGPLHELCVIKSADIITEVNKLFKCKPSGIMYLSNLSSPTKLSIPPWRGVQETGSKSNHRNFAWKYDTTSLFFKYEVHHQFIGTHSL